MKPPAPQSLRCAVYTRKSCEEGLEQNFNSLHAQRESCEAYILSQAGEGWTLLADAYDDGGFSGGSMERPGLKALLAAIEAGRIDVVVVYKVDRLSRSLADFARMVELFDRRQVSFVSVTQAFNTTTSMGRLTLNVLLSFAQFEREVTGERIRDKIAASKKKGLWMGGRPPLGYNGVDSKLVINPAETEVVRQIFRRYLELGSVVALHPDLEASGVRSKRWTGKDGRERGGGVLGRGALYCLLANPVYRGVIRHKQALYPDCHPAIIDEEAFSAAQRQLKGNSPDQPDAPRIAAGTLLQGRLFDDRGNLMAPVHTRRGNRRYRYYASTALKLGTGRTPGSLPRIAIGVLDTFVVDQVAPLLATHWQADAEPQQRVADALVSVRVGAERVEAVLKPESIARNASGMRRLAEGAEVSLEVRLKHRQGAIILEPAEGSSRTAPRADRPLIRALVLARAWADQMARGDVGSVQEIARREGLCHHYTARLMPLAFLAPELTEQILQGRQPATVSLSALTREPLPFDWSEQRQRLKGLGCR